MSNIVEENKRVLTFLAQGIKPTQVLSMTGLSADYVKSLLQNEEVKEALTEMQKLYAKEAVEDEIISSKYLSLEHKILGEIELNLGNADMPDLIRALDVVSKRQDAHLKRKVVQPANNNVVINHVQIQVPMHSIPEFTLNAAQEVVRVGDKTMAPMTSKNVMEMFKAKQEGEKLVTEAA